MVSSLDPRIKLISMLLISICSGWAGEGGLLLFTVLLAWLVSSTRMAERFREYRMTPLLLVLVGLFLARGITVNGFGGDYGIDFSVTPDSLKESARICWRLVIVTGAGMVFISSTSMMEMKAAIEWFLKPIPLISEKRVSTAIGLMVRFLPLILEEIRRIRDAQISRCIQARKNPVATIRFLIGPLFHRIFRHADRLVDAMQSRCYTEHRVGYLMNARRMDWMALGLVCGICFLSFCLPGS